MSRFQLPYLKRLVFKAIFDRGVYRSGSQQEIIDSFHRLYYDAALYGGSWRDTYWLGVPILKSPFDVWVMQEILHELKPDLVIETGSASGGSALFYASIFDLIGAGRVITVDIEPNRARPKHPRITYVQGSSTSPGVLRDMTRAAGNAPTVVVALDSDHSKGHVLHELRAYADFVTPGSYLVVEDTNVNGHPVFADFGPGPMEAVDEFLQERSDFSVDRSREKFFLTFNPGGYLRRVRSSPKG